MTLDVPFESFAATVKRLLGAAMVFVANDEIGSRVTAADPAKTVIVTTHSPLGVATCIDALKGQGLEAQEGRWRNGSETTESRPYFVSAIAYRTDGPQVGLWVDASPSLPTPVQAIRTMYDEFMATGEVVEVPFDEFVRLTQPNVVVLTPSDLKGFVDAKACAPEA